MDTKKVYFEERVDPYRVGIFSNGPNLPTGYAKVVREISSRLANDNDFEVIIFNENGGDGAVGEWQGIPVYNLSLPVISYGENPTYDRTHVAESFMNISKELNLDVVIFLEDSFTLRNFGFEGAIQTMFKRIFYIPLDGGWIPETGINVIRTMDKLVAMSVFTQNNLSREGFDSDVIWHGVNLELFSPVSKEKQAQLKIKHGFNPDDFIVFNYGRNSNSRKNNQSLLWIMSKYLSTAPDNHKFFMHTLEPEFAGNNLFDYVSRHLNIEFGKGVTDRLIFSPYRFNNAPQDSQVAEMIQLSDLVVTASSGEGFGLLMAEAMACGKPIISTDYTTPHELLIDSSDEFPIGPRGWVVPVADTNVSGLNTEHAFVDKEAFVSILRDAVSNPDEITARGLNGRYFAEVNLNWDYLVESWKQQIRDLVR